MFVPVYSARICLFSSIVGMKGFLCFHLRFYFGTCFMLSAKEKSSLCWTGDMTWTDCCHPRLGLGGNSSCWWGKFTFEYCCLSSPEDQPPPTDLLTCAIDPYLLLHFQYISIPSNFINKFKSKIENTQFTIDYASDNWFG